MLTGSTRRLYWRRTVLIVVAGVLGLGVSGGCPGDNGGLVSAGSGGGIVSDPGTGGVEPDAAEATAVLERQAGTVALAEAEGMLLAQVIDEDGGVHEFVVLLDEAERE